MFFPCLLLPFLLGPEALAARPTSVTGWTQSTIRPVRCHHARDEDHDLCRNVVAWSEIAWDAQVGRLGFEPPVPDGEEGGSNFLDIYLVVDETGGPGVGWADCDGGDGSCIDADPDDGMAAASAFIVADARTENLRPFVVHEFNHVLQYATDYAEPFLVAWEGTAVASEHWTLPDWFAESWQIADYQAIPWASALLQDSYFLADTHGIDGWYEYGAMIWVLFLDHAWGDGNGSIGPLLWAALTQEGYGLEPDVLDAWDAISGDWRADLMEFEIVRARMGVYEDSPSWVAFAEDDAVAWREREGLVAPVSVGPSQPPYPLGASFFDLEVSPGSTLRLALQGDETVGWGLGVLEKGNATWEIASSLEHGPVGRGPVTLVVVNLGPPGLDADDPLSTASFELSVEEIPAEEDTGWKLEPGDTSCGCGNLRGSRTASLLPLCLGILAIPRRRRRGFGGSLLRT